MKNIVKIVLIILILSQSIFAASNSYYQEKFNTTKKLYLGAIMSNNKEKEITYLKKLIQYGKKLKVSTTKYNKELQRINTVTSKNIPKIQFKKRIEKKQSKSFIINSVIQSNNTITINYKNTINKTFINFDEKKVGKIYYDTFKFKGNFKDAAPMKLTINGVDKISIYQKKVNELFIDLKHRKNLKTIYIIEKKRIIIKINDLKAGIKKNKFIPSKIKRIKNTQNILYPSKKTIVIDAGHGGRDGGANYKKKRFEKNITLNVSKYLKNDLEKKGFTVFLTRSQDKYVKLSNRTKYANKKHADIFISVHANAARKSRASKAHGIESYFLSPARSARAKRVAALENKGDMTGMGWSSKDSLLTILNRAKITAANKMAIDIQKHMLFSLRKQYGKNNIRDGGVREGPFWVLVGAQMPSVLVEVGYITHPNEGYRISTKKYQKIIAKGISEGIESYFIKN